MGRRYNLVRMGGEISRELKEFSRCRKQEDLGEGTVESRGTERREVRILWDMERRVV